MSVTNIQSFNKKEINLSASFFEKREMWKNKQVKRGGKSLFEFCLDLGIRFEHLVDAGIIQRNEESSNNSLSDFQLTDIGSEYIVAEYESFWVIKVKLEALENFIEGYLYNQLTYRLKSAI